MAPVYADHPFHLIETPKAALLKNDPNAQIDMFDNIASEMASVHNMLTMGLNAIYLQAPHIKPADEKAFLRFIRAWYNLIHVHHSGEETALFPEIEKWTGANGLMEVNVEQHHKFHGPLEHLREYYDLALADKEKYDGARITAIIDDFGPILTQHLNDEIPTFQGLRKYGDKLAALPKAFDEEGEKNMKLLTQKDLCCAFANLDIHRENGIWYEWPAAPTIVKILVRWVFWWFHTAETKFGAVDRLGRMKPLYAVPKDSA